MLTMLTDPRIASGATTLITRMPAPLTAITVLTGFTAASLSASGRGTAGAADMAGAVVDGAAAAGAAADTATAVVDTAMAAVDTATGDMAMLAAHVVMLAAHAVMPAVA